MQTFTLDTNCIISLDEGRTDAPAVRALVDAHATGAARVAVVAISASERQRGGGQLQSFTAFQERLAVLGLAHLEVLHPMAYADICYLDHCLATDEEMERLERSIHEILFPNIEFLWPAFCKAHGTDPAATAIDRKWLNAKCDVQMLWCHINGNRDVFVTADEDDFHAPSKKAALIALGAKRIERYGPQIAGKNVRCVSCGHTFLVRQPQGPGRHSARDAGC
jgi:hypothetical protein